MSLIRTCTVMRVRSLRASISSPPTASVSSICAGGSAGILGCGVLPRAWPSAEASEAADGAPSAVIAVIASK